MENELITIDKKTFQNFVVDLEKLLTDFETIVNDSFQFESEKRTRYLGCYSFWRDH